MPRFQPIELLKPFLIIFISIILSSEKYKNVYFKYSISFLTTLIIVMFLVMQPDIGQTLLILFTWSVLIFISGISISFLIFFFSILILSFSYLIIFVPKFGYIKSRLLSFFDSDAGTHNFQSDKAIDSIISGGFFGKGIGEGTKNLLSSYRLYYVLFQKNLVLLP